MPTIEERLAALETEFAEIKKLKSTPGPRGPAGDISAALANAKQSMAEDLADALKKFADLQTTVKSFDGKLDNTILERVQAATTSLQETLNGFKKNIEDEVAGIVVKILQEYYLLDSECRVLDHLQQVKK